MSVFSLMQCELSMCSSIKKKKESLKLLCITVGRYCNNNFQPKVVFSLEMVKLSNHNCVPKFPS